MIFLQCLFLHLVPTPRSKLRKQRADLSKNDCTSVSICLLAGFRITAGSFFSSSWLLSSGSIGWSRSSAMSWATGRYDSFTLKHWKLGWWVFLTFITLRAKKGGCFLSSYVFLGNTAAEISRCCIVLLCECGQIHRACYFDFVYFCIAHGKQEVMYICWKQYSNMVVLLFLLILLW